MPSPPPIDPHFIKAARLIADEYYWRVGTAREVTVALTAQGMAVLGVEIWDLDQSERTPRWLGSSDYQLDKSLPWPELVEESRSKALDELNRPAVSPGMYVALEWASRDEMLKG